MNDSVLASAQILVADDREADVYGLKRLLQRSGYRNVRTVSDGREVQALTERHQFDILLLDLYMPRVNGFDIMRELRATGNRLPILIMTADASSETKQRALEAGATDFLTKPYDPIEVGLRIRNMLDAWFMFQAVTVEKTRLEEEIGERLRIERELRVRTRQLDDTNHELEAFSYSVSHDLRAPLRAVHGFAAILDESYSDVLPEEGLDYLRRIRAGATRMGEMIDALQSLSRMGRVQAQLEVVDLTMLAEQAAKACADAEPQRIVDCRIDPGMSALGDRSLLGLVFQNLLQNAWKFTRNSSEAHIRVGSLHTNNECAFFVRDNGAGFDMANADNLFSPFYRLHSDEEFEGTGIGLATVRRIVDRLGGRVWAEGAPGEGATVYFSLLGNDHSGHS